ncbi:Calx-beta domain-containing protein [Aquimarina sp. AU474]|uniref:beta strand repeat-containing protein n=1 Tax=Aquimarina sp. AU474 TaxID=2108529 RepID=UPI000D6995E5|nr:Calx-beta domain-containing protein [Aquimarina sp. AU474]
MKLSSTTYLIFIVFLFGTLLVSGQTTFADNFTTQAYNRNDGTGTWSTNWIETNDNGSPTTGDAFIFLGTVSGNTNVLAFVGGTGHGINRTVDLSGAASVTLSFDWVANGLDVFGGGQEELGIFMSNNNGVSFTQIGAGTIVGTNNGNFTQDISAFISANTVFRLQVIGGNQTFEGGEFAVIDNLVISGTFGPSLSITDATFNETAGTVSLTVNHIGTNASGPFTVDVNTINGTAFSGSDFNVVSGSLSFSGTAGDSDTIDIAIVDDSDVEVDEIFSIGFTNTSDPAVDITDQATITITDNETDNPRPYEERITFNVRGNFDMIGNTNLTCTANCAAPVANNPPVVMGYASIDGTTVNSSSADLTLPVGATVTWAGLYWGGNYSSSFGGINNPDPSILSTDQVRFRVPGSATYNTITANISNYENSSFNGWAVFQSYADVTSLVQGAGSGSYTIADIALTTGSAFTGPFGGWTMIIIYENPADITRSVSIWDGFDFFGFGANDSFTVTGLLTPSSGAFDTDSGYFGFDGEAGAAFIGDFVAINGTALSNGLNPANNTLNSTISKFGVDVGGRNPNQSYNWGLDIDIFDATGLVPNNATSLDVDLGSANEGIWGGVFAVSTEVAFPAVANKTFAPTRIGYGEESTVTILLENPATGVDLTNLTLTDNLPTGMNISTTPNPSSSCGGTITAVSGSDNFSISGVSLPAGNSCTFTFDVIATQGGTLSNTVSSGDITNDQNIPLAGTTTGILDVIVRTVITNRKITYRVNRN